MPKEKKPAHQLKIHRWTPADLRTLRRLAGKHASHHLARVLKRSPAALRYKAHILGISLKRR